MSDDILQRAVANSYTGFCGKCQVWSHSKPCTVKGCPMAQHEIDEAWEKRKDCMWRCADDDPTCFCK